MQDTDLRFHWVDRAKGIGILLVIFGHTIWLGWSYPIYAFHMPLFFFLSGYLVKSDKLIFTSRFICSKAKALMVPLLVALTASAIVCLMIPVWREALINVNVCKSIYRLDLNFVQNSSLWFLPVLLMAHIVLALWYKVLQYNKYIAAMLYGGGAVLILFSPYITTHLKLPYGRMPLLLDSATLAFCFVAAGWLCRRRGGIHIKFYVALGVLVLAVLGSLFNGWANMNSMEFGRCRMLYYPIAMAGVFATIYIAEISESFAIADKALQFLGRHSLVIFCAQSLLIRAYILVVNKYCGLNMVLYGNNPIWHQIGAFFVVAFIASPIVVFVSVKIRHFQPNR